MTPKLRERWFYMGVSLVMFPPLFMAGLVSRLADDDARAGRSLVRDAVSDARTAIEIAFTEA